jgi:DivIVA domain-containing protein
MPLAPKDIASKKFSITRGRGYDRDEVETYLSQISSAYVTALDSGREAPSRMLDRLGHEVAAILRAANESGATLRREAEEEAENLRRAAIEEADALRRQARDDAIAERDKTDKELRSLMEDSRNRAQEIRDTADRESKKLLDEAIRRYDRLQAHERKLRERVDAMERVLVMLRTEMGAGSGEDSALQEEPSFSSAKPEVVDLTSDGEKQSQHSTSKPKARSDEASAT